MNVDHAKAENTFGAPDALGALKRFARPAASVERCELCGNQVGIPHPHLLQRQTRKIQCSCEACAILFCGQQGARYLRIPQTVRAVDGFSLTDLEWEELLVPIQMAFFFREEDGRITAMYPSAAGAIEAQLAFERLYDLFEQHEALRRITPLTEALLINRVGDHPTYLIVPIDECFRLTGLIRTKWRGLSGGAEVWSAISQLLAELQRRAMPARQERHA